MEANLPEQKAGQYVAPHFAPPEIPMAAAPAIEADVPPAVKWEEAEKEGTRIDRAEIAPEERSGPCYLRRKIVHGRDVHR